MCWAFSCTRRFTTEVGSILLSTISASSHWPPTISIKGPWSWPRGSTQPEDCGCVAPHSVKRALFRASSAVLNSGDHSGPTR